MDRLRRFLNYQPAQSGATPENLAMLDDLLREIYKDEVKTAEEEEVLVAFQARCGLSN